MRKSGSEEAIEKMKGTLGEEKGIIALWERISAGNSNFRRLQGSDGLGTGGS
jgi:hypothetical protein